MTTSRVTIKLEKAQLEQLRALVAKGAAASVSGFIRHAVAIALDEAAGWSAMLAGALTETGGPITAEERAWAERVLGTTPRPSGSAT